MEHSCKFTYKLKEVSSPMIHRYYQGKVFYDGSIKTQVLNVVFCEGSPEDDFVLAFILELPILPQIAQ